MNTYIPLALRFPRERVGLPIARAGPDYPIGMDSPAFVLMSDFMRTPALTVSGTTPIDDALNCMMCAGVRFMFVVDAESALLGSITSYDIQSEKPTLHLQSKDCRIATCSRADVQVRDIMMPVAQWRVLRHNDLMRATLGDIAQTFKTIGQRHIVVVEAHVNGGDDEVVRGLISASNVERALGSPIMEAVGMESFSDIARVLTR